MKSIALLGLALAMSPTLAAADQTPTSDAVVPPRPNFAAMRQLHEQMEQIHLQARQQMLASLTPAHRQLVASVIGQLAIAAVPNREAAARSLDLALSPSEARAVLAAEAGARTQTRTLMDNARSQFEASLTPDQRAAMQARAQARMADRPMGMGQGLSTRTPDAGMTLLGLAGGHDGMRGPREFGMEGPPPEPPQ